MRRLSRSLSLVIAAAVLAAGCSSASKPADNAGTSAAAPVDASKPVVGGTFTETLNYGDPGNLDPIMKSDVAAQMVTMNIFDTLVKYDPVKKQIVKDAAEDYSVSADGLTYTFNLKHGVMFTNGREMKAADVKYSLERAVTLKNKPVTANLLDGIAGVDEFKKGTATEVTGIKVTGDYGLTITLKQPKPSLLADLGSVGASIVPKEVVEKEGPDFGQHPVGSGPFVLADWRKDDQIVLQANDKYFGGRPYLDKVVFRIMTQETTRDAEFQGGTVDAMVLGDATYKKYSNDPKYKDTLVAIPELFTRAIHFNLTKAPFDNKQVRQAINYAVDKAAIVKKVLNDKAYPATGVLPSSIAGFDPNLKGYDFNLDKAKELLAQTPYAKGFTFDVNVTATTAPWMEAINTYLAPLGIQGKINQMDGATLLSKARSGDYTACIYSTGGDADPISFLGRFWSKNIPGSGDDVYYKNDQVDQILAQASQTTDPAKRIQMAQDAQKIIVDDAPWFIFNYNKAVILGQPWVHGLQPVPTDIDFQDLSKVWVSKH